MNLRLLPFYIESFSLRFLWNMKKLLSIYVSNNECYKNAIYVFVQENIWYCRIISKETIYSYFCFKSVKCLIEQT